MDSKKLMIEGLFWTAIIVVSCGGTLMKCPKEQRAACFRCCLLGVPYMLALIVMRRVAQQHGIDFGGGLLFVLWCAGFILIARLTGVVRSFGAPNAPLTNRN
jgi:hypothetical protein